MYERRLSLEEMLKFVHRVAETALGEERPFDAGILVQGGDGSLSVLMTPPLEKDEQDQLARDLTAFLEEKAATQYVYMTELKEDTRVIYVYAATREGRSEARRFVVDEDLLHVHPHEDHHPFMELFPRTIN